MPVVATAEGTFSFSLSVLSPVEKRLEVLPDEVDADVLVIGCRLFDEVTVAMVLVEMEL